MDVFSKFVNQILKFLGNVFQPVIKLVSPPKAFSWQTLIYLSVFSLFMSYLSDGVPQELISTLGWIFLIAGTSWSTIDHPRRIFGMPLGALITGALVSVFAFGQDNRADISSNSFVLWPTLSALITAVPEFIDAGKSQIPRPEVRQRLIVLVGGSLVISCWLQFFFVLQGWMRDYPSLSADNLNQSAFVRSLEPEVKVPGNGAAILNELEPLVIQEVAGKSWSQVERWLSSSQKRIQELGSQVITEKLAAYKEKDWWQVESQVVNANAGYNLKLHSVWIGPTANGKRYFLTRTCQIEPSAGDTNVPVTPDSQQSNIVAKINCVAGNNQNKLNPPSSRL